MAGVRSPDGSVFHKLPIYYKNKINKVPWKKSVVSLGAPT